MYLKFVIEIDQVQNCYNQYIREIKILRLVKLSFQTLRKSIYQNHSENCVIELNKNLKIQCFLVLKTKAK